MGEDPVTSLIRAAEIRQSREEIKVQFLRAKLQSLTARNKSLKKENECFEKAIQKLVSIVDQKREEYKLIECVHAGKHGLGKTGRAITNTDYLIYLKQLHRSIANKNKIGFYFHQRRRILE